MGIIIKCNVVSLSLFMLLTFHLSIMIKIKEIIDEFQVNDKILGI